MQIFSSNVDKIEKFNSEVHSYKMGVTEFADLTQDEFKEKYLSNVDAPNIKLSKQLSIKVKNGDLPDRLDWREAGIMSPVEHQHECGSCWTFSSLEVLQAVHALNGTNEVEHLSKQQLIDCARGVGNSNGCEGGNGYYAYQYTKSQKVLCTEDEYEYLNRDYVCSLESTHCSYRNYQTNFYAFGGEDQAQMAITQGPLVVSIDATNLNLYKSGIVSTKDCPVNPKQNHAVVLAGYGSENGIDYWLIKNSWGADFGEGGYFRLERNSLNSGEGACAIGCFVVGTTLYFYFYLLYREHEDLVENLDMKLLLSSGSLLLSIILMLLCYCTGCCYKTKNALCCCCRKNKENINDSVLIADL